MKWIFGLLALYVGGSVGLAQALAPSRPVLTPGSTPVLAPGTPATAPRPVMQPMAPPPQPGSPTPASPAINPGINAAAEAELQALLLNMQAVLEQTIPALAAYNDNSGFATTTNTFTGTGTNGFVPPGVQNLARSGQNFSSAHGGNFSSRTGANLSGNASSVIGVSPAITMPSVPAGASATPAPITDSSVPVPAPNTAGAPFTPRETLQALLLLQHDLERALALVEALNATPNIPEVNLTPTGR